MVSPWYQHHLDVFSSFGSAHESNNQKWAHNPDFWKSDLSSLHQGKRLPRISWRSVYDVSVIRADGDRNRMTTRSSAIAEVPRDVLYEKWNPTWKGLRPIHTERVYVRLRQSRATRVDVRRRRRASTDVDACPRRYGTHARKPARSHQARLRPSTLKIVHGSILSASTPIDGRRHACWNAFYSKTARAAEENLWSLL